MPPFVSSHIVQPYNIKSVFVNFNEVRFQSMRNIQVHGSLYKIKALYEMGERTRYDWTARPQRINILAYIVVGCFVFHSLACFPGKMCFLNS